MGATAWLQVNDEGSSDSRDNSLLLALEPQLAALATRLGVRPLTDFYDYSALADEAAGEFADELAEADIQPSPAAGAWFPATEGLPSFEALAGALTADARALGFAPLPSQSHWLGGVVEELTYCTGRLHGAAGEGRAFRLLIVP